LAYSLEKIHIQKIWATSLIKKTAKNNRPIWDRCNDFENILPKKIAQKIGLFDNKQSLIMQNFNHNIGF
jgi:hypothetical protein